MNRSLVPSALLTLLVFAASLNAQKIDIRFDYSNAEASERVFGEADSSGIDRLLSLPATQALIAKRATRDKSVTARLYKETLLGVRAGRRIPYDPFHWRFCLEESGQVQSLLAVLHGSEASTRAKVQRALAEQLDQDMSLVVTVHYVIGGVSAGWESEGSDFYISLPFYKGDAQGIVAVMQHELFHNAQYVGFHGQAADLALLNARQRELYLFLDELYREGTANFVGKLASFPPNTPFIQELRVPTDKNAERMSDNFVLFETLYYRLGHDPSSHFKDVESIGFDWDWQNPMYFVGEYMATVVAGERGTVSSYLKRRPTAFARDYISACAPQKKCLYPISADVSASISLLDSILSKAQAAPK